jgi:hypothetical protein
MNKGFVQQKAGIFVDQVCKNSVAYLSCFCYFSSPKIFTTMKNIITHFRLMAFFVLVAISNSSIGQPLKPVWISTGDYVAPTFMLETPEWYIFGTLASTLKPDGNMGDPFVDWGSIIVSTDKNLMIQDSIFIQFIDDWYVMIYQTLLLDNGQILLTGRAFHTDSNDYRLGMIWLDESLNQLHHNLVGIENHHIDPSGAIVINQSGNLVTWGHVPQRDASGTDTPSNQYFFIEMEQNGEIINSLVQNLDSNPYYLWPVGADKYHMWSWENSVVQLNADLSYDTTYPINLSSEFFIWRTQPYNDQSYFLLGDRPFGSPGINEVDIAVVHVDNEANVLNSFVFGFDGELASRACLSSIDPEVLFIGGTRSRVDYALIDSTDFNQIFIHKTNISGEILRTSFYSTNGSVMMGNLIATSDGGCLISGGYYDFMNYPFTNIMDAFFLKMDTNGIITSLHTNKTPLKPTAYTIHPNPVKDKFRIQCANGQTSKAMLYSLNGALVQRFEFVSDFEADVSNLMPGAYLLQFSRQDGYMESRKLIIMNR